MQPLDLKKLTPWNLEANTCIFISDLGVHSKTLLNLTFTEIAAFHKSPTVNVKEEDIVREAKAQNKFLKVSSHTSSIKPLRPDISDIELALIHATSTSIPDNVICDMLNISKARLIHIRKATKALYNIADTPLPSLPLVTITDTSRFWSEDELFESYKISSSELPSDYGKPYKDLLRRLESQAANLEFPINDPLYGEGYSKGTIPKGTSIPSTLLKENEEDYSELSRALWAQLSREEGVSGTISPRDGGIHDIIGVNINYTSAITTKDSVKVLTHQHEEGGYNKPLNIPSAIIKMAINIYNLFITSNNIPPSLERLVINLLSAPNFLHDSLSIPLPPLSSSRGHVSNSKEKYLVDTPPLIYPKFTSKTHGFGIICHKCSTFLSSNTITSCKHITMRTYSVQQLGAGSKVRFIRPSIYLYVPPQGEFSPNLGVEYSLYYYKKDVFGNILEVFTPNLLQFYSNFNIPLHRLPNEN